MEQTIDGVLLLYFADYVNRFDNPKKEAAAHISSNFSVYSIQIEVNLLSHLKVPMNF